MANTQEAFPTQQFVDVESVENDIVKLKTGGLRKILLVSGLNFDLKSEEEQGMITYAFQNVLNSLNFSLQIFIHSRKLNIESYLSKLERREAEEPNELLKNQIVEYREFIKAFVSQNAIMAKTFFVVIPYDSVQMPQAGIAIVEKITGFFKKKSPVPTAAKTDNSEQLEQLSLRVDQVISGLNQIGLRAVPLNTEELTELFYNLYNPTAIEKKDIETAKN